LWPTHYQHLLKIGKLPNPKIDVFLISAMGFNGASKAKLITVERQIDGKIEQRKRWQPDPLTFKHFGTVDDPNVIPLAILAIDNFKA